MVGISEWSGAVGQSWRDHLDGLEATLAPVNDAIMSTLHLKQPLRVAEVGCGGGGFARHLAQNTAEGSHVTGFDISPDLVEAAKLKSASLPVDFICADAETHILTGQKFDRLTSRFGIMFFPNEEIAFKNLKSWLKPGGQFAFAVWDSFAANPWMNVVREIAEKFVDTPQTLPKHSSPVRYADTSYFIDVLEQAGFSKISTTSWNEPLKLGGGLPAPEAAKFGLSAFWGTELPASHQDQKRAVKYLTDELRKHEASGVVSMAASIHIVTGQL